MLKKYTENCGFVQNNRTGPTPWITRDLSLRFHIMKINVPLLKHMWHVRRRERNTKASAKLKDIYHKLNWMQEVITL